MYNSFCKKTIILILTLLSTLYSKDNSIAITFKGNTIIDNPPNSSSIEFSYKSD